MQIAVVEYNAGNIFSVKNALDYLKLDNKLTIVDTPGFIDSNAIYNFIDYNKVRKLYPKTEIKVKTFQVRSGYSVVINDILRIENTSSKLNSFSFYMNNKLRYEKLSPKNDKLRSKKPKLPTGDNEDENDWENIDYLPDPKEFKDVLTPAELRDIKLAFSYLDKDNSKTITADELKEELKKVKKEIKEKFPDFNPDDILDMVMKKIDTNGDGKITFNEFIVFWIENPIFDLSSRENCDKLYKEFTRDGKDKLNQKTLDNISKELMFDDDSDTIKKMIFYGDADQNKEIDEDEFYNILNPEEEYIQEKAIEWRDLNAPKEEKKKKK